MSLLNRLLRRITIDEQTGCWLWGGTVVHDGYGQIYVDGRMEYVHRVSYELHIGPIPDGLQVDHVRARGCVHRHCCNPEHLEAVTPRENGARSSHPSWVTHRTGVCKRGHEQTPDNVYVRRDTGHRRCRPCTLAAAAASYERKKILTHV